MMSDYEVPDRTGETWRDGDLVFLVVGTRKVEWGDALHPVLVLAVEGAAEKRGSFTPGERFNMAEGTLPRDMWEKRRSFERIA